MSEIDDIFASKGNAKVVSAHSHGPSSSSLISSSKKEKKKRKKQKSAVDVKAPVNSQEKVSSSKKRRLPETVIDTSNHLHSPPKRHKTVVGNKSKASKVGDANNVDNPEDVAIFNDSRGTSSRKKTEEGWLVYKEDELGISHQGGDTPLCPFDCDCCF